jgi:hypothetical protein
MRKPDMIVTGGAQDSTLILQYVLDAPGIPASTGSVPDVPV